MTAAVPTDFHRMALIVDDLRINRSLLQRTLTSLRYSTMEAVNGVDALRQLDRHPFALVFLDWELPGEIKGDQVARHLRSQPTQTGTLLIAITSDTSETMRRRCAEARTDAFLGKALDPVSVQNAITLAAVTASARSLNPKLQKDELLANENPLTSTSLFAGDMPAALRHCREELLSEHRQLSLAAATGRWPDAARATHNLGAIAGIVGLPLIREAFKRCEIALRRGDPAALPPVLGEIDQIVSRFCMTISESISGD